MVLGVLLLLLCFGGAVYGEDEIVVAAISDLHINMGSSSSCMRNGGGSASPARYWCDSPPYLVQSAIQKVAELTSCPPVMIVTGDVLRHRYENGLSEQDALNTFTWFQQQVSSAFGRCDNVTSRFALSPVLTLGNNDLMAEYSAPPPAGQNDTWLEKVASVMAIRQWMSDEDVRRFVQGGFYGINLTPSWRVLVLNTNLLAAKNSFTSSTSMDPAGQMQWLERELSSQASSTRVWIVGHISPGMDHYSGTALWHDHLATRFYKAVQTAAASGVLAEVLFGHEHAILERPLFPRTDDISSSSSSGGAGSLLAPSSLDYAPIRLHGSVSCDKGNNPSVRQYRVSQSRLSIMQYEDVICNISSSSSSPLSWIHSPDLISPASTYARLSSLLQYLNNDTNPSPSLLYCQNRALSLTLPSLLPCPPSSSCLQYCLCSTKFLSPLAFAQCQLPPLTPQQWSMAVGIVAGAAGVALIASVAAVLWKRRRLHMRQRNSDLWTQHSASEEDDFDAYHDEVTV